MFQGLSDRLSAVFDKLKKQAVLSEDDVNAALREVRVALLEADVALPVARDLIGKVREQAVGQDVLRSVTPVQQVVKIVHDCLVDMLTGEGDASAPELNIAVSPPAVVLMAGLQGSGKTTSTAKIALRLKTCQNKKVLMASLDTRRPAAQEQLAVLGQQTGIATLPIVQGQNALQIAERALKTARLEGYDVLFLDTAGRLSIDEELMAELVAVRDRATPTETLLVADAMTGQDAVATAQRFHEAVSVTGIVLTRIDGDARGGAALSMRAVTGQPIRYLGVGEKIDALEAFHPDRIAGRILGMGDVVSLVEKAAETIEKEDADKLAAKMQKGQFDLEDFATQMKQMRKMGGMSAMMGMLPGMGGLKKQMQGVDLDDKVLTRQEAIISSMTPTERKNIKILNGSRRRRIAAGSGVTVQDVNRLIKQFQQMQTMMRKMRKLGPKGLMRMLPPGMLPSGTLPSGTLPKT